MIFRKWADALPSTVEVTALRLPGREGRLREEPFVSLAPLVSTINEVLEPYLDKPFAFFGHSMGAAIGYEWARLLQAERGPQPCRADRRDPTNRTSGRREWPGDRTNACERDCQPIGNGGRSGNPDIGREAAGSQQSIPV